MNKIFLSIILTFTSLLLGEGFAPGTLVKAIDGYVPIEEIKVDQFVAAFDAIENKIIHNKVIATRQNDVQSVINIKFNDEEIFCSPDQRIFIPFINKWFKAKELLINKKIRDLFCTKFDVLSITEISNPTELYTLTVKSQHNFLVTEHDVLAHNFAITLVWVIGEGLAFEEMAALLASGLAGWGLGKLFFNSNNNNGPTNSNDSQNNPPPDSPKPPDEEDNAEISLIKIFEKSAKHMFSDREGHLKDTLENRKLLIDMVNNEKNFLGIDKHGSHWYAKNLPNGNQIWASTWNNTIRNGGVNEVPHTFNNETGLSKLLPPR